MSSKDPSPDSAATPESEKRTRSGRVSKPPVRYEPVEDVTDDYGTDDYDSHEGSEVCSEVSYDESEIEDEEDIDDLRDFVVTDKSESDSDDSDGKPAVPLQKRAKQPTPVGKRVGPTRRTA